MTEIRAQLSGFWQTCYCNVAGITKRLPLNNNPFCTDSSAATEWCFFMMPLKADFSGHPSSVYFVNILHSSSFCWQFFISCNLYSVAGILNNIFCTKTSVSCRRTWSGPIGYITGALDKASAEISCYPGIWPIMKLKHISLILKRCTLMGAVSMISVQKVIREVYGQFWCEILNLLGNRQIFHNPRSRPTLLFQSVHIAVLLVSRIEKYML